MDDDIRVDLSAIGPALSADRFEGLVAAATRRGEDELQRRRGGAAVVRVVVAWRRPLLAFSGLAAAAAIALLLRSAPVTMSAVSTVAADSTGTVAEELGIPAAYAQSVEGSAAKGGMDYR